MKTSALISALPIGARLNEFEIRSVIGVGGFSIVYLAYDKKMSREVAIKEYLPVSFAVRHSGLHVVPKTSVEEIFEKGLRHFVKEAHILAKLRHPTLATVLQFFETNGTAYLVMPYYSGKTLQEIIDNRNQIINTHELMSIFLPLLNGLSQIHEMGFYHLDISADNIIILKNGSPILLDFGSSRIIQLDNSNDDSTIILKHGFAPIEQYCNGEGEMRLGEWSDIYALSAVMRYFITGKIPLTACARAMDDTLHPLVDLGITNLPVNVLKVIDTGMAVRPENRPQTIESFSSALKSAAELESEQKNKKPPILAVENINTSKQNLNLFFNIFKNKLYNLLLNIKNHSSRFYTAILFTFCKKYGIKIGLAGAVLFAYFYILVNEKNDNASVIEDISFRMVDKETTTSSLPASKYPILVELAEKDMTNSNEYNATLALKDNEIQPEFTEVFDNSAASNANTSTSRTTVNKSEMVESSSRAKVSAVNALHGQIVVSVIPWGHISFNGKFVATVPPNLILNVSEGKHTITITNESNTPCVLEIEVKRGRQMQITHDFLAETKTAVMHSAALDPQVPQSLRP